MPGAVDLANLGRNLTAGSAVPSPNRFDLPVEPFRNCRVCGTLRILKYKFEQEADKAAALQRENAKLEHLP